MRAKDINQYPIPQFLESISIYPERKFNGYWIYKSILNPKQRTGSLKVSSNNLWVDYSLNNVGGTLIDLILMIYPELTVKDVIKNFNTGFFSFQQHSNSIAIEKKESKNSLIILGEYEIYKKSFLCDYLQNGRGLKDLELCNRYLKTVHYMRVADGKEFWNLGYKNFKGGYHLFYKGFKRVTQQGFTLIQNECTHSRIYFESMLDFLSFLMIYNDQEFRHEYCILNTVNNLKLSFETLQFNHLSTLIAFMDKDVAGDKASSLLKNKAQEYSLKFYDYRSRYIGKDLNDFLIGKY